MSENMPSKEAVDRLLSKIQGLIGLSAKLPNSRTAITASQKDKDTYEALWKDVDRGLATLTNAGFPFVNPNSHEDIESMWAWCISFGEPLGAPTRKKPNTLYRETIDRLEHLKQILSHADAPLEVQRELRESANRTNELFIIMAFREETLPFRKFAEAAALSVGLKAVFIDRQEPENAISEAILSAIRRATLVLCDLSFERPNCYFEAGFAKGALRRVVYSCRGDHDIRAHPQSEYRVHFDVDQFKITWWQPDKMDASRAELEERLSELLRQIGASS
jgi:hypothetical protein